jgi:hypothetical protein
VGRHRATAGRVTTGGDDGLAQHLTALDDRSSRVVANDADVAALAGGPDVEDLDEIRGVAPRRELLDGDVSLGVAFDPVDELDANAVVVERREARQPRGAGGGIREARQHVVAVRAAGRRAR